MTIKAVGFDLDDTLYDRGDFYRFVFDVMESTIVNSGVPFERFYDVLQYYSDIEYEKFIREGKTKDDYKNDRVIDTYKELGKIITYEHAIVFNALYLYFRDRISYRDGVEEVFQTLLDMGIELFVLTNGPSADQRNKLNHLNVGHFIPKNRWFISDEMSCSKPDKEIFKRVQEEIGHKEQEIIYVGDNYVNDILGAKAVGWQAILLNVHKHNNIAEDTIVINNMVEVIQNPLFLNN